MWIGYRRRRGLSLACLLVGAQACSSATGVPTDTEEPAAWEALEPLPVAVRSAAVATDGARVFVVGGSTVSGRTTLLQILDLEHEGVFYLIGGQTSGIETSSDLLEYDPVADSWTTLRPIPVEREAHGVASSNGLVCAIGGRLAAAGNFNTPYDDVSCYDPTTDRWEPAPLLPRARQELAAVTVGDLMIAIGGADEEAGPVSDVTAIRLR